MALNRLYIGRLRAIFLGAVCLPSKTDGSIDSLNQRDNSKDSYCPNMFPH